MISTRRPHPRRAPFAQRSRGLVMVLGLALLASGLMAGPASADDAADGETAADEICNPICDGTPATEATSDRLAGGTTIFGRSIQLHIDYEQKLGWATISGDPTDEVWLDRSFDGGETVDGERLGYSTIPEEGRTVATGMFNLTDASGKTAVLRACGKAGNRPDTVCSEWLGDEPAPDPAPPTRGAVDALMKMYNEETGLWDTTGWWNSANVLTSVIDYAAATGDDRYDWIIANTYEKNLDEHFGDFTNEYIDDTGWWVLAWIRAYDYTGEERYLETARTAADYMWSYRDDVCGGGLWWRNDKQYKNAVTNELFIKAAAQLHTRVQDDNDYLEQAVGTWEWFLDTGMINDENLINDGLVLETCESNKQETWTYNQGIVLGALNDLYLATDDDQYLDHATTLADASTTSAYLNPGGTLREPCEDGDCGGDGPTFKGVYVRNLAELAATVDSHPYRTYLTKQARTVEREDRNAYNQYGVHWAGPVAQISAATQTSAFEALTGPIRSRAHR